MSTSTTPAHGGFPPSRRSLHRWEPAKLATSAARLRLKRRRPAFRRAFVVAGLAGGQPRSLRSSTSTSRASGRVLGLQRLDAAHGVQHRGVVAPAEAPADVGQGAGGDLLGQPHGHLPRAGRPRGRGAPRSGPPASGCSARRPSSGSCPRSPCARCSARCGPQDALGLVEASAGPRRRRRGPPGCSAPLPARARCR